MKMGMYLEAEHREMSNHQVCTCVNWQNRGTSGVLHKTHRGNETFTKGSWSKGNIIVCTPKKIDTHHSLSMVVRVKLDIQIFEAFFQQGHARRTAIKIRRWAEV